MIKVIVCGASGEIGSRLVDLINRNKEMKLMFAIEEENHPRINKTVIGDIVLTHDLGKVINETDVVVDFSDYPKTGLERLATAAYGRKAIIIGTANPKNDLLPEINLIKHLIDRRKIPCIIVSPIITANGLPASPSCQRNVFACDVVKAIKWIVGKPAGLYGMWDVLATECFRN